MKRATPRYCVGVGLGEECPSIQVDVEPAQTHNRMAKPEAPKDQPASPQAPCLMRTVTRAMAEERALEAVQLDRERGAVSVAMLGQPQRADTVSELTAEIQRLKDSEDAPCALLEGTADCKHCSELPAAGVPGQITVRQEGDVTTIARVTCPTAPRFWRWREVMLPRLVPREIVLPEDAAHEEEWKPQLLAAALCGLFGLIGALTGGVTAAVAYPLAYLAGAWFTAQEVWERMQQRVVDIHFLMLAVAMGSAAIGAWGEGAVLLFLFSLSGALEHYAMGRTHREIRSLFRTAPKTATSLDAAGHEHTVPVDRLHPGMRVLVRPGEQFAVDAEIVRGRTASDESNLTGEAVPVEKDVGDSVLGGTLNLWGVVEATVLRPAGESALQRVIRLIQEAQHLKAPSQRFTDRFGSGYTYAILGLCLVMFFVWWLAFGQEPFRSAGEGRSAFYQAMTLLVVASPCALVLSIPSAILAAIAVGARQGILFRGGAAVERLAEVDVVAMDKTGTLTTGELQVERVESFPPGREGEVAAVAYGLERLSNHPLARAITRYGKQQGLPTPELERFESVTGSGLQAWQGDSLVRLGKREWLAEGTHAATIAAVPGLEAGYSEVWVTGDGLVGRLLLRDDIRPEARELVGHLHKLGLPVVVLTGDRKSAGRALQDRLGLDDVRAELKPDQKVDAIQELVRQGRRVAMVGDGVNDAPSLAAAHVGVAMGARGSDAALEQAEVVLMHDRLENFLKALQLSQRARRIIRQNLVISLGTVITLVAFALVGRMPLTLGVLGHEGSTVLVVLNSLRLFVRR
jgi:Zn2+/Cd2+-exporting ATPase